MLPAHHFRRRSRADHRRSNDGCCPYARWFPRDCDLELAHDPLAGPVRLIKRRCHNPVESFALGRPAPCGGGRTGCLRKRDDAVPTGSLHEGFKRRRRSAKGWAISDPRLLGKRLNTITAQDTCPTVRQSGLLSDEGATAMSRRTWLVQRSIMQAGRCRRPRLACFPRFGLTAISSLRGRAERQSPCCSSAIVAPITILVYSAALDYAVESAVERNQTAI